MYNVALGIEAQGSGCLTGVSSHLPHRQRWDGPRRHTAGSHRTASIMFRVCRAGGV